MLLVKIIVELNEALEVSSSEVGIFRLLGKHNIGISSEVYIEVVFFKKNFFIAVNSYGIEFSIGVNSRVSIGNLMSILFVS